MKFPSEKYSIIYADPPWPYRTARKGKAGLWGLAQDHYPTMTYQDMKELPVNTIAKKNSFLFMWVTYPQLHEGLEVMKAWGFEFKTVAFTWVKMNKQNNHFMGMGFYTRSNAEICLLGKKGNPTIRKHDVKQIIQTVRESHSKKPAETRDRIIRLCGNKKKIELFARDKILGWDNWGNHITK